MASMPPCSLMIVLVAANRDCCCCLVAGIDCVITPLVAAQSWAVRLAHRPRCEYHSIASLFLFMSTTNLTDLL